MCDKNTTPATISTPADAPAPGQSSRPTGDEAETRDSSWIERMHLAAVLLTSEIPDFWSDQPRVWFIRVGAILAPQKMSVDSKFNIVVSKLGKKVIQQVTDVLINPPAQARYDTLKKRLLHICEESENRQLQKVISEMELGEQKPSQLLRRMRDLARRKIPDDTLRILWQGHHSTVTPPLRNRLKKWFTFFGGLRGKCFCAAQKKKTIK